MTSKQDHGKQINPPVRIEDHPLAFLLEDLEILQRELMELAQSSAVTLQHTNQLHMASAVNLIHYLGMRRRDMRPLQERLAAAGLSSLGRAESHVHTNLNAIIGLLRCALGKHQVDSLLPTADETGDILLERNTGNLLGKSPEHRHVRIMVTLPSEVADDYALIKNMLLKGMDCARINCAHDDPETWARMIEQIKLARLETGKHCRILMDLGGPKLRTGEIAAGSAVLKWRPQRDMFGKVTAPARIWLHAEDDTTPCPAPADACLPVAGDWLAKVSSRDIIELTDARGAVRTLQLVDQAGTGFGAESNQTTYIKPGIELKLMRVSISGHPRGAGRSGTVGALPPAPELIRLNTGDSLTITR
ncbi:MAG: pyruvate kinase [Gallionella sp.]|nr:pyruvate kinase [Gallionella sp.]